MKVGIDGHSPPSRGRSDAHAVLDRQVAAPAPGRCGERAVIREKQQAVLGESDGIDRQPSACMEARQTRLHRRTIVARAAAQQLTARLVIGDDAQPLRDADAARDVPPIDDDAIGPADALTDGCGTTVHQDPARAYPLLDLPARAQSVLGEHLVQSLLQTTQRSSDAAGPATSVGVSASDVCARSSSSSAPMIVTDLLAVGRRFTDAGGRQRGARLDSVPGELELH